MDHDILENEILYTRQNITYATLIFKKTVQVIKPKIIINFI